MNLLRSVLRAVRRVWPAPGYLPPPVRAADRPLLRVDDDHAEWLAGLLEELRSPAAPAEVGRTDLATVVRRLISPKPADTTE